MRAEDNLEMANGCLVEILSALEGFGMDMKATPPMFYREALLSLVNATAEAMCDWRGQPLLDEERVEAATVIKAWIAKSGA